MNRLNIFWVILLIYVMSFFLITAAEVKDDIEAVNYNGYFNVYDEQIFIELGCSYNLEKFQYGITKDFNGYVCVFHYGQQDVSTRIFVGSYNMIYYFRSYDLSTFTGYGQANSTNAIGFVNNSFNRTPAETANHTTNDSTMYYFYVFYQGISNYEVTS